MNGPFVFQETNVARTLTERVEILEHSVEALEGLPARVASLETQILQFREEVRAEFSATKAEMRMLNDETRTQMHALHDESKTQMLGLHDEVKTRMLLLHEEVLSRMALLGESRNGRKRRGKH
jgi:hypothetical protein